MSDLYDDDPLPPVTPEQRATVPALVAGRADGGVLAEMLGIA